MRLKNFWGHLSTITRHRNLVMVHCFRAGIPWRGIRHDWSKYSPTEFLAGVRFYQGTRSPNEREREVLGYSRAWMHHKGRNCHHFEFWTDYNPKTRRVDPVAMPMIYVIEMLCDRMAASKIYNGDKYTNRSALEYFQNSSARKRGEIHPETERILMELLELLARDGEDAVFERARELLAQDKKVRRTAKKERKLVK